MLGFSKGSSLQRYEDPVLYTKELLPLDVILRAAQAYRGRGIPLITEEEVLVLAITPAALNLVQQQRIQEDGVKNTTIYSDAVRVNLPPVARSAHGVPVFELLKGGGMGGMAVSREPIARAERPATLTDVEDAYAILVVGRSMKPVLKAGQTLFVNPHLPPRPEDIVVAYFKDGSVAVRELVAVADLGYRLREYHPEVRDADFDEADVIKIHTVVTINRG
jgi:SOS-response transcriptional repressor LexA